MGEGEDRERGGKREGGGEREAQRRSTSAFISSSTNLTTISVAKNICLSCKPYVLKERNNGGKRL